MRYLARRTACLACLARELEQCEREIADGLAAILQPAEPGEWIGRWLQMADWQAERRLIEAEFAVIREAK